MTTWRTWCVSSLMSAHCNQIGKIKYGTSQVFDATMVLWHLASTIKVTGKPTLIMFNNQHPVERREDLA